MKLPIPFLSTKKTDSDYYLALIITDEKASAIILQAEGQNIKTIGSHEEFFPGALEDLSRDELINSVDKAISRAEEVLPPNIETHKTVFGVKNNWVENESKKIKKEYLEKLKKVCDALDLSPIGFMVTTEAVTHLIQDEEAAPLSAVFADIGKHQVTLNLLRGGKILETVSTAKHESAAATVDKLLSHFTVPVLPARIVLFLNKPDTEASQAFISHQWSKNLPFLHMPQVTVLPKGFEARAVMFGAATQMGFTVIDAAPTVLTKITPPTEEEEAIDVIPPALGEHEKADEEIPEDTTDEKAGDFGFVVNGEPTEEAPSVHSEDHEEKTTRFSEADNNLQDPVFDDYRATHHSNEREDEDEKPQSHPRKKPAFLSKLPFALPKNLKMPKFGGALKGLSGSKAPLKIIVPIVVVILLLAGTAYFYLYKVKATVTLTVSPNMVNQDETVTFVVGGTNDFANNKVIAQSVTASLPGTVSTNATGKKDVGDKAKGTVTIYNNSDSAVTLNSGAEIKASNGQIFTLDKDTKLDAASGDIFSGTKPGTSDASVTAKTLGAEGNIPSGTRFSIGSSTELAARNDNAFSGGTTKNVTVVAQADIDKLRADLPKSIQGDAKSKLAQQAQGDETVLPVSSNPSLAGVKFDKKVGDEASKVTATGSVVYTGIAYQKNDLKEYAKTVLQQKNNDDTTLDEDKVDATVKDATEKDAKTANASVTVQGGLLPKINTQDVIDNIKDKSLSKARELIANLPQVTDTNISFSPPIPVIPNIFPSLPKQITVEVKTE